MLFVETWADVGGGQKGLLDLLEGLDKSAFQPMVLLPQSKGSLFETVRSIAEVEIVVKRIDALTSLIGQHPFLPLYAPGAVRVLAKLIREISPNIVHANQIFAGRYACPAAQKAGVPSILTVRNVYGDKTLGLHRFVDRRLIRSATRIVFNSRKGREVFYRRTQATNVMTILNGIKLERFVKAYGGREALRQRLGMPVDCELLVVVAKLTPAKGIDVVLKAVPPLLENFPNAHLAIVGNEYPGSGTEKALRELAGRIGIADHVSWCGAVEDVSYFYSAADFTVLPSVYGEGLPRVILESLACRTPVVASGVAGVPDVVRHGENGFLCEPGDVSELVDALRFALSLPEEERRRMGNAGLDKVKQEFGFKRMLREYEELYSELIDGWSGCGDSRQNSCI